MAQRFSPNTSVAEQILLNPTFANIDFADFQGLNMNLIDRNAEYAQNIANRRFEGMLEAQTKLLEEVKLNQKFDYLEKDLQNKLASVIDNAGNVQLSDNANFNKLNTNLISLKADPQLRRAVYSSEEARKAKEILDKDPNLRNRPWDAPGLVRNYDAFLNNETNDFTLTPIYKNVEYLPIWDDFFSKLPKNEQIAIVKYKVNGIAQAKEEGFNKEDLIKKIQDYKQFVIVNNPEIKSNLERRSEWAQSQGLNPQEYTENFLNEGINASASKFAGVNRSLTNPQRSIDKDFALDERRETRMQNQLEAATPVRLVGTTLLKGDKGVEQDLQNQFNKQVATLARKIVIDQEKDPTLKKNMNTLPANLGKTIITQNTDGTYNATVVFQPAKAGAASITKTTIIPSSQIQSIANMYNTSAAPISSSISPDAKSLLDQYAPKK
jgi:hypothetical protein